MLELLAAGIDCRPVAHAGGLRVNITITEPDGTTTKLNSPGPTVTPEVLQALAEALRRRAGSADWVVLAGSLPPGAPGRVVRRAGRRRCASTAPASPSTPARPRSRALVDRLPRQRPAPDEAQRRGARLAHRRRPATSWSPTRRRRPGRAHPGRAGRRGGAGHPRRPRRRPGHRGRRLARHSPAHDRRQHRRCRRLQPLRLPARGHPRSNPCRTTRTRRGLRQRGRRTSRHDHPHTPRRSRPSWSPCATSTSPKEGDDDRTDHDQISFASTWTLGSDKADGHPRPRRGRRRRRPRHRRRTSSPRTPGPRGDVRDRAARRDRDPPLPHRRRRRSRRWPSPGSSRRSTSAPRTARPTCRS